MQTVRVAAMLALMAEAPGLSCVGTTGGELVTFHAAASGPDAADPSRPFEFLSGRWHVVLTKAALHVGAVYLDQSHPVSGAQGTNCVLGPNTYTAQVAPAPTPKAGLDVDLLSAEPQRFSIDGQGITIPALVGQIWLTGGDVNAASDNTPILLVAGTADDGAGTTIPFEGTITIPGNRPAPAAQTAGDNPICKQRIVSVPTNVTVQPRGGLLLQIDPRQLFVNVPFEKLTKVPGTNMYIFDDGSATQPSGNLYSNLQSMGGLYTFSWSSSL